MTAKRLKYSALAALILGLSGLVACQKGTQTTGYQSQGTLTATVGSTNYAPSLTEAVYSPITYTTFAVIGLQPAKDSTYLRVELPLNGFTIGTPFSSNPRFLPAPPGSTAKGPTNTMPSSVTSDHIPSSTSPPGTASIAKSPG